MSLEKLRMSRTTTASALALLMLSVAAISGACGETGTEAPAPAGSDAGSPTLPDGEPEAALFGRRLTLTLDPTIDGDSDDPKATLITSANLLDTTAAVIASASIVAGAAVFDLTHVPPGDYSLTINGKSDDLVPTRIDDTTGDLSQRVGQKLRASYIGPTSNPSYRITTWSAGSNAIVRFSDLGEVADEHPYMILSFATAQLEIRVLGTARTMSSFALPRCPGHDSVPPDAWLLNTRGEEHHGDSFNADGGASACGSCHWEHWVKPLTYPAIRPSNGWCFKCHAGPEGTGAGFIDPSQ